MKVIVGLGNPGEKYVKTRHNIGWHIVDALAAHLSAPDFKENKKFKALISEVQTENGKILLVKPLTFMNLSGDSAIAIKTFYKLSNEDFIVVYDDIDLPLGELRFRTEGGAGTHNGMKSLIKHLGNTFPRLRFGIENRPKELKSRIDLSDYVLNRFAKEEEEVVKKTIGQAISKINEELSKN